MNAKPIAQPRGSAPAFIWLALLALSYFFAFYDRQVMPVLGELVKREFALSDRQLSLLTGASFVLLYGAAGIAAGWLVDRWSRRRIIVGALLLSSLFTMTCGLAQSFLQLMLARAGVGIGQATTVPAALSAIADRYPPARRPLAAGIFYTGGMVGLLVCFLGGTWVAARYGWRAGFLVAGPPGVLAAAVTAVFFQEPAREVDGRGPSGPAAEGSSFAEVWRNRPLRWLLFANALGTFANLGVLQWLPNFFIRSHHLSVQQVGLYFGPVFASGMAAGLLAGGVLGNRVAAQSVRHLIRLCAVVMLAIVPLYILVLWLPSLVGALAATFVGTVLSVLYAPSVTAAWQTLCAPRARGTTAGISSFANSLLGGALCSYCVGFLSDLWAPSLGAESLRHALSACLVFCVVAAALFAYSLRLSTEPASSSAGRYARAA